MAPLARLVAISMAAAASTKLRACPLSPLYNPPARILAPWVTLLHMLYGAALPAELMCCAT